MGRSTVMAETLDQYSDILKTRVSEVRKEIANLQKPTYYKEAVENFVAVEAVEVPDEVAENWIDQLTIKQFNEELKDVFPYVYKLIGEGTKADEITPDDLMDESALMAYAGKKKHGAEYMKKAAQAGREGASQEELGRLKDKYSKAEKKKESVEEEFEEALDTLMGQFVEAKDCDDCGCSPCECDKQEESTNESNMKKVIDMIANADNPSQMVMDLVNKGGPVGNFLYSELEQLAVEAGKTFNNAESEPEEFVDELLANMGIEEGNDIKPEKQKTPIGEFILSYFDRENGTFPKGETAVLTMVEKDYGEQYVKPAAQFMQQAEAMCKRRKKVKAMDSRYPMTDRIKELAGLR
jgi:hypothetical protein